VLRPEERFVSVIDLVDHSWYGENTSYPDRVFHYLQYPEWLWNLIRWNRSSYVNRLRQSGHIYLLMQDLWYVRTRQQ